MNIVLTLLNILLLGYQVVTVVKSLINNVIPLSIIETNRGKVFRNTSSNSIVLLEAYILKDGKSICVVSPQELAFYFSFDDGVIPPGKSQTRDIDVYHIKYACNGQRFEWLKTT